MICSSTSISSHSRSRWPTWSIRSGRPGASSSGATAALVQVDGFFLMAGRGERNALARLVNDLESIPNTDGGGGGLSPRLEAELLAMLTRTSHPQATTNERTLTAGLFSLLGMMAGAVLVLALLWLVQLNRSLQDQAERIDRIGHDVDRIGKNVDHASAAQRLALETLLAKSASAETANDPDAFLTQYRKTGQLLDEAKDKLEEQTTINGTMAARVRSLDAAIARLNKELDQAKTFESDAKDVAKLRDKLEELETENKKQASKLADQQEVLEAIPARGPPAWCGSIIGPGGPRPRAGASVRSCAGPGRGVRAQATARARPARAPRRPRADPRNRLPISSPEPRVGTRMNRRQLRAGSWRPP